MTRYQVDSEAVIGATGAVRTTISRIEAECVGLSGLLSQLESSWQGAASAAFGAAFADWKSMQQMLEQNLGSINHALGVAGHQYAETEIANARLFAR